ncbi:uncharacterized protein LOC107041912 [Diachasma alloeum]|uniref:uncharacterized protein LOC107041912 n=1 Tax=Diachasma alloeum TaxID=454923 RepID=UPI000738247B|nr:uncharacterized protein LOC107041912 [Diachasma alloeum]
MEEEREEQRYIKLRGAENRPVWRFQMRIQLMAIEGYGIVQGENPKPAIVTDPPPTPSEQAAFALKLKQWEKIEGKAQRLIVNCLNETTMHHVMTCTSAKEMWDALNEVYASKTETAVHMLQQEWFVLSKDPRDDIAEHVSKVQSVAHKLKPLGETVSDCTIMTKILLTPPPTLNHFYSAWESTAMSDRTLTAKQDASSGEKSRWKKKGQGHGKKPGECNYCHKQGHWEYECREKLKHLSQHYEEDSKTPKTHGGALMTHVLSTLPTSNSSTEDWYLDSAASSHMLPREECFVNLEPLDCPEQIVIGDGKIIIGAGRGNINVLAFDGKEWVEKHIHDVLLVPELKFNLFSTAAATDKGLVYVATSTGAWFKKNGETVAVGEREAMSMKFRTVCSQEAVTSGGKPREPKALISSLKIW